MCFIKRKRKKEKYEKKNAVRLERKLMLKITKHVMKKEISQVQT